MRVALEIILELSIEQQAGAPSWPHPWDHYPFVSNGRPVWLRYRDLDPEQRELLQRTMAEIRRRLARDREQLLP